MTPEEPHLRFHMDVHTDAEVYMFTHTHLHLDIHKINIIKLINPSMNN